MNEGRSLWSLVPYKFKLSLIPLIVNALLVQAGPNVAYLLNKTFGRGPSSVAVEDISAVLLFLNFCVAFWTIHLIVVYESDNRREVEIGPILISLAPAFLSIANFLKLFVYSDRQADRPGNFIFAIFIIVYFLIFPFIAIKIRQDKQESTITILFRTTTQYAAYSLALVASVLILCTSFYVLLNKTLNFNKDLWVINPAALGIGIAQVSALAVGFTFPERLNLSRMMWWSVLMISVVLNAITALTVISNDAILYIINGSSCQFSPSPRYVNVVKLSLGVVFTALFWQATYLSILVRYRLGWCNTFLTATLGVITFMLIGSIAGITVVAAKYLLGCFVNYHYSLIWMHAVGFVLAFLGIFTTSRIFTRNAKSIQSLI